MDELRVRAEFDRRAALYGNINAVLDATPGAGNARANLWRDYATRRLAGQYVKPAKTDVLLDLGCGVGRLSFYFSPLVKQVVGIDVSPGMVAVAQGQLGRGRWDNVTFQCAEVGAWALQPGSVTKALCFWTLSHVSDGSLPLVLRDLHRALAPQGRLLCFEQVRDEPREEREIHLQRTAAGYGSFFADAGLRLTRQRLVLRYPSYALALWNRFPALPCAVFPLLRLVERATVNRRPESAEYYTCLFDLERGD